METTGMIGIIYGLWELHRLHSQGYTGLHLESRRHFILGQHTKAVNAEWEPGLLYVSLQRFGAIVCTTHRFIHHVQIHQKANYPRPNQAVCAVAKSK